VTGVGFDHVESERLVLRRFEDRDLVSLLAYRNDPEIARYQGWKSVSERAARDMIRELKREQPGTPGEWFQFAIALKSADDLIGDCALKVERGDARQAEIGFTLSRAYQGKGYAAEAVSRLLDYAFDEMGLHRVFAVRDQRNEPSFGLLQRLGLRREGSFVRNAWFKGEWASEYLYAGLAEEWLHERRGKHRAGSP
jgi:RimJ/RimL family protein N-acetyltransferase